MLSADVLIIPKITQFTRGNLASKAMGKQVENPSRHVYAAGFAGTLLMIASSMINSLPLSSHLCSESVAPGLWHGAMVHVVLNERVAWQRDAFTFPFSLPPPDDRPRLRGLRRAEGRCRSSSTFRTEGSRQDCAWRLFASALRPPPTSCGPCARA